MMICVSPLPVMAAVAVVAVLVSGVAVVVLVDVPQAPKAISPAIHINLFIVENPFNISWKT